jgi:hypothetical protein
MERARISTKEKGWRKETGIRRGYSNGQDGGRRRGEQKKVPVITVI